MIFLFFSSEELLDIEDLEILDLVKSIPRIRELGLKLGYGSEEVDAYEDENRRDLTKRDGTYAMLKDWCNKPDATRAKLVQILRDSNLAKAANKLDELVGEHFHLHVWNGQTRVAQRNLR